MNRKPRFLLIAHPNSYRIAPYIRACQTLGLECLIASRGEHSLISEVSAGIHIDLDDHDAALAAILDDAGPDPYVGVLGCDDSTVELAAKVAQALQLPHNPPQAAKITRRKDLARAHLANTSCAIPGHRQIDIDEPLTVQLQDIAYPCVLKPIHLSASRGVIRADDEPQALAACERIRSILAECDDDYERRHVLIEQYIDGIEVAFEGYLHEGELHPLALFDKPEPLTGPFFEETIYVTPSSLDDILQERIKSQVQQACDSYQLRTGPVHAELRVDASGTPWILEVASRTIGGDCARTLDTGSETSIEQLTVELAMGVHHQPQSPQQASGVMMIPIPAAGLLRRVEGLTEARKTTFIEKIEIVIPAGHELKPLPEGNQYPGYIFARAPTSAEVTHALREAHEKLNFVIAPLWKIDAA